MIKISNSCDFFADFANWANFKTIDVTSIHNNYADLVPKNCDSKFINLKVLKEGNSANVHLVFRKNFYKNLDFLTPKDKSQIVADLSRFGAVDFVSVYGNNPYIKITKEKVPDSVDELYGWYKDIILNGWNSIIDF